MLTPHNSYAYSLSSSSSSSFAPSLTSSPHLVHYLHEPIDVHLHLSVLEALATEPGLGTIRYWHERMTAGAEGKCGTLRERKREGERRENGSDIFSRERELRCTRGGRGNERRSERREGREREREV